MEDKVYREIFSENLKHYMKKKGNTQTDLIKALNLSKSTISTWCRGTRLPRMHHMQALADYFDIDKTMLLENTLDKVNLEKNSKDISFLIETITELLTNTSNLILDGKPANDETISIIITSIQIGVELAKGKIK